MSKRELLLKKIKENKQLNLNKNYHIIKYEGYNFDEQIEYLLIGPEYSITFYEEKDINKERDIRNEIKM